MVLEYLSTLGNGALWWQNEQFSLEFLNAILESHLP